MRWAAEPARRPERPPGRTYDRLSADLAPSNGRSRRLPLISCVRWRSEGVERLIISRSVAISIYPEGMWQDGHEERLSYARKFRRARTRGNTISAETRGR
jgi:hypothetical protein